MQVQAIIEAVIRLPYVVKREAYRVSSIEYRVSSIEFTIRIPTWLESIAVLPVLLYRRLRYGYPFRRIPLTQGKYAIVDTDDYHHLSKHKWYAAKMGRTFYAARAIRTRDGKQRQIAMHRQLLKGKRSPNFGEQR